MVRNGRVLRFWLSGNTVGIINYLPQVLNTKELVCKAGYHRRCRFSPWVGRIPWRRAWKPTPVFLPGQRSLMGYSQYACKESDMTEVT